MYSLFATNRSLASAVTDQIHRNPSAEACAVICDEDLRSIQKTYVELVPGLDVCNMRNEPALLIPLPVRNRAGDLVAVIVLLEPMAVFAPLFDMPQLGPGHSVTLLDGDQTLLAQVPSPVSVDIGQRLENMALVAGPVTGSFWFRSPIDGRQRLTVPGAGGGQPHPTSRCIDTYRAAKRRSLDRDRQYRCQ